MQRQQQRRVLLYRLGPGGYETFQGEHPNENRAKWWARNVGGPGAYLVRQVGEVSVLFEAVNRFELVESPSAA